MTPAQQVSEFIDWRGRIGWALIDCADKLYDTAHRLTRGQTPTPDTFTLDHLIRVAEAIGVEASELARVIEERGTVGVLR